MTELSYNLHVEESTQHILDACTRCAKCVDVCPVVPHAGVDGVAPNTLINGVLDVLGGGRRLQGSSQTWAEQCDGCGRCIPACPEDLNPRTIMMNALSRSAEVQTETPYLFRKMSRAIRLLAAMQLSPHDYSTLLRTPAKRDAEAVFYVGCNAVRTPHLLFNAMFVLDALEIDYEVLGGSSACCGIIHGKWEGERAAGIRVVDSTLEKFGNYNPKAVMSWCPSCQLHLGETMASYRETEFEFDHVTKYMLQFSDRLSRLMRASVPLKVVLHAHEGFSDICDNVAGLLRLIPGLELLDVVYESGYTCGGSGSDRSPALKKARRDITLQRMKLGDADALVSLYHGCHGQLSAAGEQYGFKTINFTDLLVRSLGGDPREDFLAGARMAQDWQAAMTQSSPYLRANNIAVDRDWLLELLPEIFAGAEFVGGLDELR